MYKTTGYRLFNGAIAQQKQQVSEKVKLSSITFSPRSQSLSV